MRRQEGHTEIDTLLQIGYVVGSEALPPPLAALSLSLASLALSLSLSPSLSSDPRDLFMQLKSKERPVSSSCAWLDEAACERDNCSSSSSGGTRQRRQQRQRQQRGALVSFPPALTICYSVYLPTVHTRRPLRARLPVFSRLPFFLDSATYRVAVQQEDRRFHSLSVAATQATLLLLPPSLSSSHPLLLSFSLSPVAFGADASATCLRHHSNWPE